MNCTVYFNSQAFTAVLMGGLQKRRGSKEEEEAAAAAARAAALGDVGSSMGGNAGASKTDATQKDAGTSAGASQKKEGEADADEEILSLLKKLGVDVKSGDAGTERCQLAWLTGLLTWLVEE